MPPETLPTPEGKPEQNLTPERRQELLEEMFPDETSRKNILGEMSKEDINALIRAKLQETQETAEKSVEAGSPETPHPFRFTSKERERMEADLITKGSTPEEAKRAVDEREELARLGQRETYGEKKST